MFNREHQNGEETAPTASYLTIWKEDSTYGEIVITVGRI